MRKTSVHALSALIILSGIASSARATTVDSYFTMQAEIARQQGKDPELVPAAALVMFRVDVTPDQASRIFQAFNILGGLAAGPIATARGTLADFVRLAEAGRPEVIHIEASRPVAMNDCVGGLSPEKPE